jgi:SAM-dependent methyltransferase
MVDYVWQHDLAGESHRLRLMSDLLNPSSEFHLLRTGIAAGWHCLEIGAGNGSLSQWLAQRVGPGGRVTASDIRTDLMAGIAGGNLEVREFDVVHDELPDAPYDLIAVRALLHHLPERRAVVTKMARWLKPGGWLFVQEPDFYPTWTVEPPSQKHFWDQFVQWAATHEIDYYVGRKIPVWLQAEGLLDINAEGHNILYQGGSKFAQWWDCGIHEVAEKLQSEGGVSQATLDEFFALCRDPRYWTTTIAFTVTTARRPSGQAADRTTHE